MRSSYHTVRGFNQYPCKLFDPGDFHWGTFFVCLITLSFLITIIMLLCNFFASSYFIQTFSRCKPNTNETSGFFPFVLIFVFHCCVSFNWTAGILSADLVELAWYSCNDQFPVCIFYIFKALLCNQFLNCRSHFLIFLLSIILTCLCISEINCFISLFQQRCFTSCIAI